MHQSEVSIIVVAYLWCLTGASFEAPEAPFLILYNKGASLRGTLHWPMRTQLQGHMILIHPITGKYYLSFLWEILPYIILKPYL